MSVFDVKTWGCETCHYKQDFEPSQENHDLHFNEDKKFPVDDLTADACPNCALNGTTSSLVRVTDPTMKSQMSHPDDATQQEIDELRAKHACDL